jgi:hypothetical protein
MVCYLLINLDIRYLPLVLLSSLMPDPLDSQSSVNVYWKTLTLHVAQLTILILMTIGDVLQNLHPLDFLKKSSIEAEHLLWNFC